MHRSLRTYLDLLLREKEIVTVETEVDPYLELAQVHRRVIEQGGPALLFTKVKGSRYPVVTNLFGTKKRIDLAFGAKPQKLVREMVLQNDRVLVLLRHSVDGGKVVAHGRAQPAVIADVRLAHILASLSHEQHKGERRPTIRTEAVYELAEGMATGIVRDIDHDTQAICDIAPCSFACWVTVLELAQIDAAVDFACHK